MTMRACPDCGVAEERKIVQGREVMNLDPVSGKCLGCLSRTVLAKPMKAPEGPRDFKIAQAGERDGE